VLKKTKSLEALLISAFESALLPETSKKLKTSSKHSPLFLEKFDRIKML